MPSWQSKAVNQLLRRTMRNRFEASTTVEDLRKASAAIEKMLDLFTQAKGIRAAPLQAGDIPCESFQLTDVPARGIILYFHGGGFCIKTPVAHGAFLGRLCQECVMQGLMVDYRLAPEHPYPAGIEDCFNTFYWLLDQGIPPGQIVLAGDSAGGNLVLATLLKIKQEQLPMPACGVLISPGLDFTMSGDSAFEKLQVDPVLSIGTVLLFIKSYLGENRHEVLLNPLVSPLFADLSGLPPLYCLAGEEEIVRDDTVRLHNRAKAAGLSIRSKIWPGMPHVFPLFDMLPEARQATTDMSGFIRDLVTPSTDEISVYPKLNNP